MPSTAQAALIEKAPRQMLRVLSRAIDGWIREWAEAIR